MPIDFFLDFLHSQSDFGDISEAANGALAFAWKPLSCGGYSYSTVVEYDS